MADFDTELVRGHLDDLEDSLDLLDESLSPLKLQDRDASIAQYFQREKLDPIGKAKMLVTMGYAIDSLLFCHLKATGVKTEQHTIMNELERIKAYVGKIKAATAHQKRENTLNKPVANRIISHDLASNAAHDRDRALRTAETNRRTQERLASSAKTVGDSSSIGMHTRFANSGISRDATERISTNTKPSVDEEPGLQVLDGSSSSGDAASEDHEQTSSGPDLSTSKNKSNKQALESTPASMFDETKPERKARERRERNAAKKDRKKLAKAKMASKALEKKNE